MTLKRFAAPALAFALAACFTWVEGIRPPVAFALPSESVTTFQPTAQRQAQIEKVLGILSRPDARIQMRLAGIPEKELRGRVERMDDSQLTWAAARADQIKAAGILGVIIALLVIAILVVILVWLLDRRVDVRIKKDND